MGGVAGGAGEAAVAMETPSDHEDALQGRKKCSTKIIPLRFGKRQEKCSSLCGYREVCAIFLGVTEITRVGDAGEEF
jgi:hypothetical protein